MPPSSPPPGGLGPSVRPRPQAPRTPRCLCPWCLLPSPAVRPQSAGKFTMAELRQQLSASAVLPWPGQSQALHLGLVGGIGDPGKKEAPLKIPSSKESRRPGQSASDDSWCLALRPCPLPTARALAAQAVLAKHFRKPSSALLCPTEQGPRRWQGASPSAASQLCPSPPLCHHVLAGPLPSVTPGA